jgi:predicted DNA binding CopG/RHH family protein
MTMSKYNPRYLDASERELLKDVKEMDVRTLKRPTQREQASVRRAARAYVEKETKMNIRIAPSELAQIKERAEGEGLKYQSLVKSVLHKYVTGQLVERSKKVV